MAIANLSGGDARIEVDTSALNETLGTQSEQVGNDTIVMIDDFDTGAEADTEATIDYVDRLIMIREGTATQEIRRVIADSAGTGNLRILTVHEDWLVVPASSDDCQVSYVIQDCATIGAQFSLLQKRNTDYTSSKRLQVGDGTNFAWLAFLDGVSYETLDNSSTTEADFTVNGTGNPRFTNGYLFGGNPVSGGYFIVTPALAGELSWEVIDGGATDLNDFFFTGIISHEFAFRASTTGSEIRGNKVKLFVQARELELLCQDTQITDLTVEGSANVADIIRCREWDSNGFIEDFKLISTNGLATRDSDTSTETLEFRDITFINNTQLIEVNSNKTWNIVNPVWSPTTADESDFDFLTATGNIINERFSVDTTSLTIGGTPLTAKVYVIENDDGVGSPNLPHELTADANGLANADVVKREFTETGGGGAVDTATHATFSVTSAEYGELPIITNYTPDNDDSTTGQFGNKLTFNHLEDTFQLQTTASTARTLGDVTNTVLIENQTNPAQLFKFTGGSGVDPTVGDTIGNDQDIAEGVFVSLIQGDFVAGTMLLDTRNSTAWDTGVHVVDDGASGGNWVADFDDSFGLKDFTWLIDVDSLSGQNIYDYLNAKLDEATLDDLTPTFFDTILFWANQGTNALPVVGAVAGAQNTFDTVSETIKNEGWMIYDNTGTNGRPSFTNWNGFQSDDDTIFTPDATVNLTIHVERKDDTTDISGASVIILLTSDNSTIAQGTTDGTGDFSTSFNYTSDLDVTVRSRKSTLPIPRYFNEEAVNTITSTGMNQNFAMREDAIVAQA